MRAGLSLYCVTGLSFDCTKLTALFALLCGGEGTSQLCIKSAGVSSTAWLAQLILYA